MSEVFNAELMVHPLQFERMIQQDDMKNYFKQKLALEIAHKLIESNRTYFTYTKDLGRGMVRLRARVEL